MTKSEELRKIYFDWLFDLIKRDGKNIHRRNDDKDIAHFLYEKKFYSLVPNDDNRVEDGIKLREIFLSEINKSNNNHPLNGPCNMLEMLIALSQRMDYILYDQNIGERTSKWFWLMIENLDLQPMFSDEEVIHENELILDRFLERKYTFSGRGGLFPVKRTSQDQRKVEIWYQMQHYIGEVFP